jgi:NAD(P)-dependent dehydrogenase (short-subunit alcohol dehydrogenase family)
MDLQLTDRAVIITGGTDGLGLALAGRLIEEGAKVTICGRDEARLAAAVRDLEAAGGDVLGVRADVTKADDMAYLVSATKERFARIDGLVNNAGRTAGKPVGELSDEEWEADFQLKVVAAARLIRLALPHLSEQGGAVLNVLAISAKAPAGRSAPSSVSRAAGMAIIKALSKEVGPAGVRANAVLIGLIESGQWVRQAAAAGRPVDELYADMAANAGIPLRRVGRAGEFADLGAFLLSPRASYVTGTAINIDGGLSSVV